MTKNNIRNILIIEDDKDMREIYEIFFNDQKDKYNFDFESNAEEALKQLKVKKYDLIILDIIMEPMSGDAFFMHVRKEEDEKIKNIPILVVSVLSPSILRQLKKINHVDFAQKPVTKEQLMDKIKAIIG
ncbi:MAG: response regulator [bacterium]